MADQEKKMTRYDLKQQRRQEDKKDNGGVKLLAFACLAFLAFCIGVFAFQTIESQKEKKETFITVGEHEIKKAEYDYYFYSAVNTLYSYYGSYLPYLGLDLSQDFSTQYYSDTMTWQDYFDEQAVMQIQQVYALTDAAVENGFEYDGTADADAFETAIKSAASSAGYTEANYLKASYGAFATMKEVKTFVERDAIASAYYDNIYDAQEVTDEEITAYYEENKGTYDSVDYLVCMIEADLQTEEEIETVVETAEETETTEETLAHNTGEAELDFSDFE